MNDIKLAFKVAFSSDQKFIYQYWETHKEKVRIQTYTSIAVSLIVATVCLLLSQSSASWLYAAAGVVFLSYHFNNSGYLIASRLPIEDEKMEGRYEYLDRVTNETVAKASNSPLYFIAPHFLYAATLITVIIIVVKHL